ncbi:hypothetical protein ACP70R_005741 [Stipagrostis hirtigluma subsp. patula]
MESQRFRGRGFSAISRSVYHLHAAAKASAEVTSEFATDASVDDAEVTSEFSADASFEVAEGAEGTDEASDEVAKTSGAAAEVITEAATA